MTCHCWHSTERHFPGRAASVPESPGQGADPHPHHTTFCPRQLCPRADSWLGSWMACPPSSFASSGHHGHVPGAGGQHVPAGVPGRGQGQGQRRDDDLLPQRRAPAQLAAASPRCQAAGLRRNGMTASLCAGRAGGSPRPRPGGRAREISHVDSKGSFCLRGRAAASGPGRVPASCEHHADQR